MSLKRNDPRKTSQGTGVGTPEHQIIEEVQTGEWFESPNPFKKKGSASARPMQQAGTTAQNTGTTGTASTQPKSQTSDQPEQEKTSGQQKTSGKTEVPNREIETAIREQLEKNEETNNLIGAFLTSVEEDYLAQGGDPEKLKAIKAAAKEKAEAELGKASGEKSKTGGNAGDAKSKGQQTGGKSSDAKSKNQADRNSEGGGKMEKTRKLSDEEMEKLDPIIEQILDEIKDVPPSRQDEILKAAQRFVEICQRNNVSTESQAKLIELYRKVVVALVKSEKADMQSQQKIKNRRRVLGL